MATITATPIDAPRTGTRRRRDWARAATATARRQAAKMVSAARHHNWSPALTISGLAAIDTAAWTTFGRGAAWLALGVSVLLFDWSRDR